MVEMDTSIRQWRGKPVLKDDALRLQQLIWMCDANQSAIAELNAIVVSSFAQVVLERHAHVLPYPHSVYTKCTTCVLSDLYLR